MKKKDNKNNWNNNYKASRFRDYSFDSASGRKVDPLYTSDSSSIDEEEIGFPGEFPYTRGIHSNMYRGKLWTMRQFSGYGSPEETNERFKFLLKNGQTGLSTAFDMPTLMGYDADHSISDGEVGHCGVNISSLRDMEILFKDIDLSKISVSMTINGPAIIVFAFYIALAIKNGIDLKTLNGTLQNDILKEYIAQKEWIYPPKESIKIITDMIAYCNKNVPKYNTISISGYHIREAGSTAVQEVAFTLANGFCYIDSCIDNGMDVDDFAPRLSFFFNSHLDFFEEIAKFRAARKIWAKEMKRRYNPKNPKSMMLRFHTQTAGFSLTAQQPENNITRTSLQALAAVLGGTQSLHTNSMDETLALPSEKAAEIALRSQQIIAYESGVTNTIDPLGGSWFIESLTNEIENEVYKYFDEIEVQGGVVEGIENSFFQREISQASSEYQARVDEGSRYIIGVNKFKKTNEDIDIPILEIREEVQKEQIDRLNSVKSERDNEKVESLLKDITKAASNGESVMEPIIEAALEYATLGEIVDSMKTVFGEWTENISI
tara:strand:- start:1650 stop:3290 length:1641 start_codon:yes stop_codon:yes gene_type:complete